MNFLNKVALTTFLAASTLVAKPTIYILATGGTIAGSSESTLYNKIRAITGKSITNFIRDIRIEAACKMAKENPDLRVSDIAYQVGFKDPKYFATSFKRVMGTQPKEYFAEIREEAMALTEEGEKRRFSFWDELEPHKG